MKDVELRSTGVSQVGPLLKKELLPHISEIKQTLARIEKELAELKQQKRK